MKKVAEPKLNEFLEGLERSSSVISRRIGNDVETDTEEKTNSEENITGSSNVQKKGKAPVIFLEFRTFSNF